MASSSRALALNKLATRQLGVARMQQHAVASRILASSARSLTTTPSSRPLAAGSIRPIARQFQRQYSESPAPPPKKPGRIRRTLKWTWRLFYLSVLGTLAYVSYEVWDIRHPEPQVNPDPSKKTLVILGKLYPANESVNCPRRASLTLSLPRLLRHRLGICCSPQEARHRELQRRRHFAPKLLPLHPAAPLMYHRYHRAPLHHGAGAHHPPVQEGKRQILRG